MVFSSVIFVFYFLPIFLLGYYVSGWRAGALLTGSVAFYVWGEGGYVFLLLELIGLNYAGSLWLDQTTARSRRLAILAALVVADFLVLGFFKYSEFLAHNLNTLLHRRVLPELHQALPLGISFFTFQLVSYAVDVHRGGVKVERDLTRFAAYILMFPHLIAGPIVRYADIRDEMHADRRAGARPGLGVQYFIVGLCQKVLIANTLAPLADHAFSSRAGAVGRTRPAGLAPGPTPCRSTSTSAAIRTWPSAWPSCWASPSRRTSTTHTPPNRSPTSPSRWHMSLSSWFRDYVYIPWAAISSGPARPCATC